MKNQRELIKLVERLVSVLLWFGAVVTVCLLDGVDFNTILISGAALLSAITVSLSFIYTNFINAVIFIGFHNPYNVGDRVRINRGDLLTVKAIRTYTTTFESLFSQPIIYSNAELIKQDIINESRAKHSTFEIVLHVAMSTPYRSLVDLRRSIQTFVDTRPLDFVKDSFTFYAYKVVPGHYYEIAFWMTTVEGWGNWRKVWHLRTEVLEQVLYRVERYSISYHLPTQPVELNQHSPNLSVTAGKYHYANPPVGGGGMRESERGAGMTWQQQRTHGSSYSTQSDDKHAGAAGSPVMHNTPFHQRPPPEHDRTACSLGQITTGLKTSTAGWRGGVQDIVRKWNRRGLWWSGHKRDDAGEKTEKSRFSKDVQHPRGKLSARRKKSENKSGDEEEEGKTQEADHRFIHDSEASRRRRVMGS
eukprot:GHVQ01015540.1.p1 GENE.GHVQ01015540.1~~GHVQ01015540.1.p1  ORF type:complete len:441 (+),score=52.07 GHVQ01015540.1:73-1323(+)